MPKTRSVFSEEVIQRVPPSCQPPSSSCPPPLSSVGGAGALLPPAALQKGAHLPQPAAGHQGQKAPSSELAAGAGLLASPGREQQLPGPHPCLPPPLLCLSPPDPSPLTQVGICLWPQKRTVFQILFCCRCRCLCDTPRMGPNRGAPNPLRVPQKQLSEPPSPSSTQGGWGKNQK